MNLKTLNYHPFYFKLLCTIFFGSLSFQLHSSVFYVTPTGAGLLSGSSWLNAARGSGLQAIINGTLSGDTVWVACGTYFTTATSNRALSFSMKNGVAVLGSFQGNETSISQRSLTCGPCSQLSGDIAGAGFADNSYKVLSNQLLDSTAVLDGFVIRYGNDDRSPNSTGSGLGGGMYNHGYGQAGFCNPTVRNCVFRDNRASWGAGAFNNGYNLGTAKPNYVNCVFYQNHATIEAGGMDSYGVGGNASPTLFNCIFYN